LFERALAQTNAREWYCGQFLFCGKTVFARLQAIDTLFRRNLD